MRGTGRYGSALGAVNTAQGIGAALSTTLAGIIVVRAGYSAAFLTLAAVAAGGLLLFFFAMPETAPATKSSRDDDADRDEVGTCRTHGRGIGVTEQVATRPTPSKRSATSIAYVVVREISRSA